MEDDWKIRPNLTLNLGLNYVYQQVPLTARLPGINNLDFSIFKNFALGEGSKKIQLRADFYNAFNHPQYVPGSVNGVEPIDTTGVSQINTVGQTDFNVPSHVFTSHPRVIQ